MISYYIFFFIIFGFILFDRAKLKINKKKYIYILYLLICIVFIGGRYESDLDYEQYVRIYIDAPELGEKDYIFNALGLEVEFGFIFCCSLLKAMSLPSQSIFILCAVITFIFIGKSIWLLSLNPFLCLFLYTTHFFNLPFTQIRFGVAMALVLYGCIQLKQNNQLKYFIYILFALSFHSASLAGFIPYIISKIKLSNRFINFILLLSLVFLIIPIDSLIHFIVRNIGIHRYIAYLSETSNKLGMYILMFVVSSPLIYFKKNLFSKIKNNDIVLCLILGSFLLLPLGEVALTFARFSTLLFVGIIILLSNYFIMFKRSRLNYFILYTMILLYSFIRFQHNLSFMEDYDFYFNTLLI